MSSDVLFSVLVQVAVNGAHLLEYKHRVELERVDTISISGKVKVQAVGILSPSSVSVSLTHGNLQLYLQRVNLFVCLFVSEPHLSRWQSDQSGHRDEHENRCTNSG